MVVLCWMVLVVRAGEDGWSVMVVEEAPDKAEMMDGSAVPIDVGEVEGGR